MLVQVLYNLGILPCIPGKDPGDKSIESDLPRRCRHSSSAVEDGDEAADHPQNHDHLDPFLNRLVLEPCDCWVELSQDRYFYTAGDEPQGGTNLDGAPLPIGEALHLALAPTLLRFWWENEQRQAQNRDDIAEESGPYCDLEAALLAPELYDQRLNFRHLFGYI